MTTEEVEVAIQVAIKAERERCARIAQDYECTAYTRERAPGICGCLQNASIAAQIRDTPSK